MSLIFKDYNPRTVFVPATLITILIVAFVLTSILQQNVTQFTGTYVSLLLISGGMQIISSFFLAYNACFLQFVKFKNFGFVLGAFAFGITLYYLYTAIITVNASPNIDTTLLAFWYASIGILLLTVLSEFSRLLKYIVIFSSVLLACSLITSRSILTRELIISIPILERFTDISFWNLVGIIVVAMSTGLLFLTSNLLFEKFKSTAK